MPRKPVTKLVGEYEILLAHPVLLLTKITPPFCKIPVFPPNVGQCPALPGQSYSPTVNGDDCRNEGMHPVSNPIGRNVKSWLIGRGKL
jgi:hypothetical protein